MKNCLIVGGATISNWPQIKQYINHSDYTIACDSGIVNCKKAGIIPDLIVGDFDSSEKPLTRIETIVLPREKDDTDTVFAIKEAIKRGFDSIILIGAVGERLDHSLVNVYSLSLMEQSGVKGMIIDDYSIMELVDGKATIDERFSYFSLIAIEGTLEDVTIKNAKFTLEKGVITPGYQYATSNEVLTGKKAEISVGQGRALLVKVF